mmetsp:Transcript_20117/g.51309  ORF Transcript_20117/g.51309 Transcript_20117/m.51309 type:complete len:101 (+) Transcript_20117:1248-1550(+)
MHELATLGSLPFEGNIIDLVYQVQRRAAPFIPDTYSSDFSDLIINMLFKDPKDRPTAAEILTNEIFKEVALADPSSPRFVRPLFEEEEETAELLKTFARV